MSGTSAKINSTVGYSKHNTPLSLVCRRKGSPGRGQHGAWSVSFLGGTNVWRISESALPLEKANE